MRGLAWSCLVLCAACGDITADPDAAGGGDDDASVGIDADPNAPDADPNAPDADPTRPDGGNTGASCGGFGGIDCAHSHWCDYPYDDCGGDDGSGTCEPKPLGCPDFYFPTCACDGNVYGNACEAQMAGSDISMRGGCTPPEGMFPCGPHFCQLDATYCRIVISDVPGIPNDYTCEPMPLCGPLEPCTCLASKPCGMWCERDEYGGTTLTCPGG
jgi:hypothetical protein